MEGRLIDKRVALGVVTLFRVMPWILMGDRRPLDVLVRSALGDARRFVDGGDYFTLMRGTMHAWLGALGINIDPSVVDATVGEVTQQVDKMIADQYDDGLAGGVVDGTSGDQ